MYNRRPGDLPGTSHHLVHGTSRKWVPQTSRGRPIQNFCIFVFPVKNSNRCVKQELLHLKNTFFIKLSIFLLVPYKSPEVPWRSRTLGPLGDLQVTCPERRVPAGYFTDHLQWLLLTVSGFQPATLLKKRFRQRRFSVNFAKNLRTSFERTTPDDCFLSLSMNFEKFSRTPLLQSTSEKLLVSCTSCTISTSRYSEKLFHRFFSSILGKNNKQPFEGVHLLEILENYL